MSATIGPKGCRRECRHTWRYWHGPDRSIRGTMADRDDVRRCEHGRIWVATGRVRTNRYYCDFDEWERLSPIASPVRYRKAVAALAEESR